MDGRTAFASCRAGQTDSLNRTKLRAVKVCDALCRRMTKTVRKL